MRPTGAACAAALSFGAIRQAADQIRGSVHRTPVLRSGTLDALLGCELYFKAENLQRTGSFKARGALNAVLQQPAGAPGVVCHSAGNHGQALAWAAAQRGLPCVVVVPDTTPKCKRDAIVAYGAELVTCDPARRLETMTRIAEATGLVPVPPYDDYHVMAGQGTIAMELVAQLRGQQLDAVVVPVSGGGMCAGVLVAMRHLAPATRVYAVEPLGKDLEATLARGAPAGQPAAPPPPPLATIADGMRTKPVGALTGPVIAELLDRPVLSVSDDEIRAAMRLIMERLKVVVEPSGATSLAGAVKLLQERGVPSACPRAGPPYRVGVILCGGNLDLEPYGL